jgi:hypothetical protein
MRSAPLIISFFNILLLIIIFYYFNYKLKNIDLSEYQKSKDIPDLTNVMKKSNQLIDKNNILHIDENTLVCNNVNDENTCRCLFPNRCLKNKKEFGKYYEIIDKPKTFTKSETGFYYSSELLPRNNQNENNFCLAFWIRIHNKFDNDWRTIFHWGSDNDIYESFPSILVSKENWDKNCNSKIDVRFTNQGKNGTFGIKNNSRDHCFPETPINSWFHVIIQSTNNNKTIEYFINGIVKKRVVLPKNIKLGGKNTWFQVGKLYGKMEDSLGIEIAKMRWYSKHLNLSQIKKLQIEKPND